MSTLRRAIVVVLAVVVLGSAYPLWYFLRQRAYAGKEQESQERTARWFEQRLMDLEIEYTDFRIIRSGCYVGSGEIYFYHLDLSGTTMSNLWDLRGLPLPELKELNIVGCPVADLAPLGELPVQLHELDFSPEGITNGLDSIRGMPLSLINGMHAHRFWLAFDSGRRGETAPKLR